MKLSQIRHESVWQEGLRRVRKCRRTSAVFTVDKFSYVKLEPTDEFDQSVEGGKVNRLDV